MHGPREFIRINTVVIIIIVIPIVPVRHDGDDADPERSDAPGLHEPDDDFHVT